jgi:hypothetical protein
MQPSWAFIRFIFSAGSGDPAQRVQKKSVWKTSLRFEEKYRHGLQIRANWGNNLLSLNTFFFNRFFHISQSCQNIYDV